MNRRSAHYQNRQVRSTVATAASLRDEMKKEMRFLEKAKQRLQSAVAVYVDPVLRDAHIALQMPVTKARQYFENILALKEHSEICLEVQDVLRHKCGDASTISMDTTDNIQRVGSSYMISGLHIENESLEGSLSGVSLPAIVLDDTGIIGSSKLEADGSDADNSSTGTITIIDVQPSSTSTQLQSPIKADVNFIPSTHEENTDIITSTKLGAGVSGTASSPTGTFRETEVKTPSTTTQQRPTMNNYVNLIPLMKEDDIGIIASSKWEADGSDADNSSTGTITIIDVQPSSTSTQLQSPIKDSTPFTHEACGSSVQDAIKVLEELDESLRSHKSLNATFQSHQSSNTSFQSQQSSNAGVQSQQSSNASVQSAKTSEESRQSDHREVLEIGPMLLEAKYQFATSLPIGLDDLFRTPDDVLTPLSTLDGEWILISMSNQDDWELDDDLSCFFPRHLDNYSIGISWMQRGAGILMVSVGTRERLSGMITQFPGSPTDSRTQGDGEIGWKQFASCFLSSGRGLWV